MLHNISIRDLILVHVVFQFDSQYKCLVHTRSYIDIVISRTDIKYLH